MYFILLAIEIKPNGSGNPLAEGADQKAKSRAHQHD
jgi:hypothetical protein